MPGQFCFHWSFIHLASTHSPVNVNLPVIEAQLSSGDIFFYAVCINVCIENTQLMPCGNRFNENETIYFASLFITLQIAAMGFLQRQKLCNMYSPFFSTGQSINVRKWDKVQHLNRQDAQGESGKPMVTSQREPAKC